jgi:hypothetical protein
MLGLNENRKFALIDADRRALVERMRTYLDPGLALTEVDSRLARTYSGFNPERVRKRMLEGSPFDESRVERDHYRPTDMRYAYIDPAPQLWNRSRPMLVEAASADSGFVLVRRRAPRALDGAALHFSDCLIDQKVLFTDAYAIPLWLLGGEGAPTADVPGLFELEAQEPERAWIPNLSDSAKAYLMRIGIEDAESNKHSAALIWMHALAIGTSPLYADQNGQAVRANWPRIPLPHNADALRASAAFGQRIAKMLNLDASVNGVDSAPIDDRHRSVAVIERDDDQPLTPGNGDLAVTAGWGIVQQRAIMPGAGKLEVRARMHSESTGLADADIDVLGDSVVDVYLNEHVRWRAVPAAV